MNSNDRTKVLLAAMLAASFGFGATVGELEKGFANPPDSAKPHTWWHWMNGNISKEGITADLEAMAKVGIGGFQIFNAGEGIPLGPVDFNSPEWLEMVKHAASEADRLGLEMCMHNCAGWSSSGGPWNKPENGMKIVTTAETKVTGPAVFNSTLPKPKSNLGFYRDIAVLAFPTPLGEKIDMAKAKPTATCSQAGANATDVIDGNVGTVLMLPTPKGNDKPWVQLTFPEAFDAQTLDINLPMVSSGTFELSAAENGTDFKKVSAFNFDTRNNKALTFRFKRTKAKAFRITFTSISNRYKAARICITELKLSLDCGRIANASGKLFYERNGIADDNGTDVNPEEVVQTSKTVDLTAAMKPDGQLSWQVPAGDWTILRVGYTANGRNNHPAPTSGTGLECDKLSREAAQAHWDGHIGKVLEKLGPGISGGNRKTGFNNVLIDSYEVGTQNWTQGFEKEFKKRCGYDLTKFLPVFSGRVVGSVELTDRFTWDLRRVIADLFAENYAGKFREMAHNAGLLFSCEAYGNCPSDDLQYGSMCDITMSEFWPASGYNTNPGNAKIASSVAHVYGHRIVGAEAFTAAPDAGKWIKDPYSIKAQGDAVYCGGVNRMIYHRYAHQPWTKPTYLPGMTMGQWGTHFERTVTWWNQSADWLKYQARCQYLLQEGQFVADALFYCGEDAPNGLRGGMPRGYDFDGCDTAALSSLRVKDGMLTLPSGMRYRMLVLPNRPTMSIEVLNTVAALAKAGALVIGPKPLRAPGLRGYPESDRTVQKLADQLWESQAIRNIPVEKAIEELRLTPDFMSAAESHLTYIHRRADDCDYYFVASPSESANDYTCSFRVTGRRPEIWDPETGRRAPVPVYTVADGMTTFTMHFEPSGSAFVFFSSPESRNHTVTAEATVTTAPKAAPPAPKLEIVKAEYGYFGSEEAEGYLDLTKLVKNDFLSKGKRTIPAENTLAGDPASMVPKELEIVYQINGETKREIVAEHKSITVPEGATLVRARYGILPETEEAPKNAVIDFTQRLAEQIKDNRLSVSVNNTLAGGDPIVNTVKEARIDYRLDGKEKHIKVGENSILQLPVVKNDEPKVPTHEFKIDAKGRLTVEAWEPLTAKAETANGKQIKAEVKSVREPLPITGPWTLNFPSGWGAPDSVQLDKLISWTEHQHKDIKYFSGTATYRKSFNWTGGKASDERYVLDLGNLKNIAEVEVNGKALPTLWKPPFRTDITDALKNGENQLVVKVTNLWPNRLIGDELLPDDREWNGIRLKEWPKWVLEGKPSPTGRYTFTTWHHWRASDEPLPSGLFGPVAIRTVKTATMK
ncbi:MAG: hypothetical protein IJU44_12145 [Kiritimatiellae bacterium]|nr:hypothetical protein [Kiritimatiellia bacterium]